MANRPPDKDHKPHPDFSPFEDWLEDAQQDRWPNFLDANRELSAKQKQLVARNAKLLRDQEAWRRKVEEFEAAILALADATLQEVTRAKYRIHFDQHVFPDGDKPFSGFRFPCSVSFTSVKFGDGQIWFDGAKFGDRGVYFDGAKFGDGDVRFSGAQFGDGDVWFAGAKFGDGDVLFDGAQFGDGDVHFDGAEFGKGTVSFNGASFGKGPVWFINNNLRSTSVMAIGMEVAGDLFVRSHFPGEVTFRRLDVKGTASFSGSTFDKVPDFTDAKFDRPPDVAKMEVPKPKLAGRNQFAADDDDVSKFRKLKSMALAANDHEKDGEFFAGEMLAKRGVEATSTPDLVFNTLYWRLSDFGQSFMRPFCAMIVAFLVFAVINTGILSLNVPATLATLQSWFEAILFSAMLSLKNIIPLLGSLFRFAPAPGGHKGWFQTYYDTLKPHSATVDWLIHLGVVESIFGAVLIFLALLALRNKFRLK